ncbi:Vitamin B12 import ATP-binding protein BtuD [bioreactor metagenome]|uniref:Lipid A export ATP-binding/permease protein MsbA n=2 Tax=root TaxID=1 RepID=A0A098B832_DESHA|nr:ABC transporter ATP-binding protein [Desulfitobacterium hafniense]MEA5022000.1 ABC transporter ATP-binding protein [Desulfitobacterium hafniense]CDX05033.1 Lipid A export ATP-binding/permease protein MsbA [Desulfitobacterium hafniense]
MQSKQRGTLATIFYFAQACRGRMLLSVLCALVSVAAGLVPFWGVYQIILLFFGGSPGAGDILFWSGISVGGYVLKILFYGISTTLSHRSAYQILENIRLGATERLMSAPLGEVLSQRAGKMKNIIVDRVETIELPLAHMIPEGISNFLFPLAIFIYLVFIDWRMALASLICVPLGAIVYGIMMRNFNSQYAAYMEASNHVNSIIVEYVEGIQVIKAFNQSTESYEKFAGAVSSFREFTLAWFQSTWKLMNLGNAILPSTLLGVLPVGVLLYIEGSLTPAELTLSMILSLSMVAPVTWFTVAVNEWKAVQYAVKDVNELLELPSLPDTACPVQLASFDVELKDVSFAYKESKGDVLRGINLQIPEGSYTALVGPSGGGKSTIARLIARFWDVGKGSITIGGTDIRKIPLAQLSQLVSFVTQDNFLFNCSLLENIRLGQPTASDEEVHAAARAAQCEEFISRLEKGWATPAGEAGGKLSGGERQRIAIARAILKNAPIVILDEATAFTDPENEDKLQRSLAVLTKGKTLLVIAHRLSTIKNADQIFVLQEGRVVAGGTQQELLEKCALYQDMWRAHTGARAWAANSGRKGEIAHA